VVVRFRVTGEGAQEYVAKLVLRALVIKIRLVTECVYELERGFDVQLIEQAAQDEFDASAYKDEVYDKTLELIQKKVEGQEITAAPVEESKTQIIDLMAALKASLADSEEGRKPATSAGKKKSAKKSSEAKKPSRKKAASG